LKSKEPLGCTIQMDRHIIILLEGTMLKLFNNHILLTPPLTDDRIWCNSVLASKEKWNKLEGSFSLTSMPKHVVFYLEGPPAGVNLIIDSVTITCSGHRQSKVSYHVFLVTSSWIKCFTFWMSALLCTCVFLRNLIKKPKMFYLLNNLSMEWLVLLVLKHTAFRQRMD
jgi:hypothetical protein